MKYIIYTLFIVSAILFSTRAVAQKLNQVIQEDESSIKAYLDKGGLDPIEGIYKNFSGKYYRLGIKKIGDLYYAIILESYDKTKWRPGTIKASFESTASAGLYSMSWLMGDRTKKEIIAHLENDAIIKFKMATGEFGEVTQTQLIKLYPKSN